MKFLVTGAAGFIGNFVAERLCELGEVIGIDNLNDYYDPELKLARLARIEHLNNFRFLNIDITDREAIAALFAREQFNRVIHLAAQAGVRYSIDNPMVYIESNMLGMGTILEGCRHHHVEHLVYASSSSVYGMNKKIPFSTDDNVDHPISLYAATKKSNELMAHAYSHLYNLPTTGLRFFTVYGPWGRPDMAPFKFTKAIASGVPIDVYNHGKMQRDFTYIDDIVEGVIRIQDVIPEQGQQHQGAGDHSPLYNIYNIGNNNPVELEEFISAIENALGTRAIKHYMPMQDGDVVRTYADVSALQQRIDFSPDTPLQEGINKLVAWYCDYYCLP